MSEANRTRRGGGISLKNLPPRLTCHPERSEGSLPPRLQTLASLGLDPPLLSRRGVFDDKITYRLTY